MAELTIERVFAASPAKVFDFVTKSENLLKWWGPETMTLPEVQLDFTKTGPWRSVMQNAEGQKYTVSGQVTQVIAGKSVAFTWAWHDDDDVRGPESHVMFTVAAAPNGGTAFTLYHRELPSEEAATNHNGGWTSSLRKLERLAA